MLQIFLEEKIGDRQHGFQPGRGTMTAWMSVLQSIHKYKYVYEIDLKQCFPSISVVKVTETLANLGVPLGTCYHLENINRCKPILPNGEEIRLDESVVQSQIRQEEKLKKGESLEGENMMAT